MAGTHTGTNLPVLWTFVGLVFIVVGLRLYTRAVVVRNLGWDDHIYIVASVLLLSFVVLIHAAVVNTATGTTYGWEMVAVTVVFVAAAVAKCSLGAFLLRFILNRWHRAMIWGFMVSLLVFSVGTAVALWVNCLPFPTTLFSVRSVVPTGQASAGLAIRAALPLSSTTRPRACAINMQLLLKFYGMWTVTVDIAFAVLPWLSLRSLNMPKAEKMIIGASLSLGFIAAVCGIVRNIYLTNATGDAYLVHNGGFVTWAGAEVFVTMLCNGIPVLRPLLVHWFPKLCSVYKSPHASPRRDCEMGVYTIGGGLMNGAAQGGPNFPRAPRKAHLSMTAGRTSGSQSDEEELVSRISLVDSGHDDKTVEGEGRKSVEDDLERGSQTGRAPGHSPTSLQQEP